MENLKDMEKDRKTKKPNDLLRYERQRRGWSQSKLAELIDADPTMISRWETGQRGTDPIYQEKLCTLFGKDAVELGFIEKLGLEPEGVNKGLDQQHSAQTLYSDGGITLETEEGAPSAVLVRLTPEQVQPLLRLLALGDITMAHFDPQRREAMLRLISAVSMLTIIPQALADPERWERLNASLDKPASIDAATLEHFETLTSTCWELSNAGQLQLAEQVLPSFLPNLLQVAPYYPKAAGIAAQSLKLQSILVAHRLKLDQKVSLCEQATVYARQSNDYPTLVASLFELAVAFRYTRQYENALKAAQEALYYSHNTSPLLQSRAYIVMAEALSRCGRIKEANSYIHLAYETFPDSEHDPLLQASPNMLTMSLYEGLTYLNMGDGKRAFDTLEGRLFDGRLSAHRPVNALPDRTRLEILNHQGQAAILSNDLEKYVQCLEEGIAGAIALKSQKRLDEALLTFRQGVPPGWRKERQIKDIAERFHLVA